MKVIGIALVVLAVGIPLYVFGYKPVPEDLRFACNEKAAVISELILAQQSGMDSVDMLDIYLQTFPDDIEHGQGIIKVITQIPLRQTPEEREALAGRISLAHYQSCLSKYY